MRSLFGLVLLLGMGLAGFAVYMVQGFVSDQQTALAQERAKAAEIVPTTKIYAPTRTVLYGEPLTKDDVALIDYAIKYIPEGAFATFEELFPEGEGTPRVVLRQMDDTADGGFKADDERFLSRALRRAYDASRRRTEASVCAIEMTCHIRIGSLNN